MSGYNYHKQNRRPLTKEEKALICYLHNEEKKTVPEIAVALNRHKSSVRSYIRDHILSDPANRNDETPRRSLSFEKSDGTFDFDQYFKTLKY